MPDDGVKRGQAEGGKDDDDNPEVPESHHEDEVVLAGQTDEAMDGHHRLSDQYGQPERQKLDHFQNNIKKILTEQRPALHRSCQL